MYIGAVTTFALALESLIETMTEIRAYDMYYDNLDEYLSTPVKLRRKEEKYCRWGICDRIQKRKFLLSRQRKLFVEEYQYYD